MNNVLYTMEQWHHDRIFSARPGQEIEPEIYEQMFNCMPPLRLPADLAREKAVDAGFLMSEPHSCDKAGNLYLAFGRSAGRCYYLGLAHAAKRTPARQEGRQAARQ